MSTVPAPRKPFDFRTLDGLTLRGWIFPAAQRGPAMIMQPGVGSLADRSKVLFEGRPY